LHVERLKESIVNVPEPSPLGPAAADPAATALPPTEPIDISEIIALEQSRK
jgi:hypothetical protein